jgi:hypothetical protein
MRGALVRLGAIYRTNSQDLTNKLRHGWAAPVARERIWIDPRSVARCVAHPAELGVSPADPDYEALLDSAARAWTRAGAVVGDEIDAFRLSPLAQLRKIQVCRRRWSDGLSWEEAGAVENLAFKIAVTETSASGCTTREEILERYARLDAIFEEVRRAGALSSVQRRAGLFRRETDGVQIHLGRGGEPIFGETGTHRLAMALVLGLACVPASLGFVHESALPMLPQLRRRPAGRGPSHAAPAAGAAGPRGLDGSGDARRRSPHAAP